MSGDRLIRVAAAVVVVAVAGFAAVVSYSHIYDLGRVSQRAMAERFGLSRRKVSQLIAPAIATSNGHAGER